MKIDGFEKRRVPASIDAQGKAVHGYTTMNLAGIFVRERGLFMFPQNRGRFYHDPPFKTLLDFVNSYDSTIQSWAERSGEARSGGIFEIAVAT